VPNVRRCYSSRCAILPHSGLSVLVRCRLILHGGETMLGRYLPVSQGSVSNRTRSLPRRALAANAPAGKIPAVPVSYPTTEPLSAISFVAAEFAYDDARVLGPVDLDVRTGETVVLLGESGSGKTTALRLINALLTSTAGVVTVLGRPTAEWDPVELRRSIGYMIQDVGLFPHFTVARNIGLVPELLGWDRPRVNRRVAELLELLRLDASLANRLPHELSGGQRQRVGVARALAADPRILLCDEPFGALDPLTRAELQEEFRALTVTLEKTVVFVTHDVREAIRLGERIVVIEAGAIRFDGSIEAFHESTDALVTALREHA